MNTEIRNIVIPR